MPNVEFKDIKAMAPIESVALNMLGLTFVKEGINNDGQKYYKGTCPICKSEKCFTVTVGKGWYCFGRCRSKAENAGGKSGGDAIKLVASVRRIEPRQAALEIQEYYGSQSRTVQRAPDKGNTDRTTQLQKILDRLQPDHESLAALGISPETAKLFESGYDSAGVLKGRYLCAVRSIQGALIAFVGIAVDPDQSPRIAFSHYDPAATGDLFNQHRIAEQTELMIFRSPLELILAVENGAPIESVIAPLTECINPLQLSVLSSLMDQKQIESLWL